MDPNDNELELSNAAMEFLNNLMDNEELSEDDLNNAFNELDELAQEEVVSVLDEMDGGDHDLAPTEYKPVHDLVTHAINQAPVDFQKTFDDLLASKLEDAVAERKLELAQDLFSDNPVEVEEPTEEPVEPQVDDVVEPQVDDVVEGQADDANEEPVAEEIEELDEKNKPWLRHENPPGQHAKDLNTLLHTVLGKYKKSSSNATVLKPKSGPSAASASTKG